MREFIGVGFVEAKEKAIKVLSVEDYTDEELTSMVKDNLEKRAEGLLPDVWFWADVELLNRGITVVLEELNNAK